MILGKAIKKLFNLSKMATLTRVGRGDMRGRARDIFYCLRPFCSVLCYSKGEFERHLETHKSEEKTEKGEEEFNFGEENVMDNDMNDNKSFSVTVNCNPDEVFLDGEKNDDPIIKPPKDGIKTRPLIQKWRDETKVKTETRGRKPLNKTKDAVGPQKCKICDSTFNCSTTLGTHKFKVHHIGGEVCSQCQKVCSTKVALKAHIVSYHKSEPVSCQTCGKIFTNKHKLKAHELNTHGPEVLPCPSCGKMFQSKQKLKYHEVSFHTEQSFECDGCPKYFKTKTVLEAHRLTHKEASFLCSDCPERFRMQSSLDKHRYTSHSANIQMFKCQECEKDFVSKRHLRLHAKTHQEKTKVTCELCEKVLSSSKVLGDHLRSVHEKIKRFSCNLCGHKAYKKDKLKKHVQKVHSRVMETCLISDAEVKHAYHHVMSYHQDIPNAWEIHKKKQRSIKAMDKECFSSMIKVAEKIKTE